MSVTLASGIAEDSAHSSMHRFWLVRKELRNRMQAGFLPWAFRFSLLTRLLRLYGRAIARSRRGRLGRSLFAANIALVLTTWPYQDWTILVRGLRSPRTHCILGGASYRVLSVSRLTEGTTVPPPNWAVQKQGSDSALLASTYYQWDPDVSFEHIRESIINQSAEER